jgi:hypothetical protein
MVGIMGGEEQSDKRNLVSYADMWYTTFTIASLKPSLRSSLLLTVLEVYEEPLDHEITWGKRGGETFGRIHDFRVRVDGFKLCKRGRGVSSCALRIGGSLP